MSRALKQKLTTELNENLYPSTGFYKGRGVTDSGIAIDVDTVIVNESQSIPSVVTDPQKFPLEISTTQDENKEYAVELLATKPTLVTKENELLTNFNKRANERRKHSKQLELRSTEIIMNKWSQTDSNYILETSGLTGGTTIAGMTGARKLITRNDIIDVKLNMARQDIPMDDNLYCLIDSGMHSELLKIDDFIRYDSTGLINPLMQKGVIGELLGIKFIMRNGVSIYNTGGTLQDPYDAAGVKYAVQATDVLSAMFWHSDFVRYAEGAGEMFVDKKGGDYLGATAINAQLRAGGMISRIDLKGVTQLIQDNI